MEFHPNAVDLLLLMSYDYYYANDNVNLYVYMSDSAIVKEQKAQQLVAIVLDLLQKKSFPNAHYVLATCISSLDLLRGFLEQPAPSQYYT